MNELITALKRIEAYAHSYGYAAPEHMDNIGYLARIALRDFNPKKYMLVRDVEEVLEAIALAESVQPPDQLEAN